jgi:WD40 repeat protein
MLTAGGVAAALTLPGSAHGRLAANPAPSVRASAVHATAAVRAAPPVHIATPEHAATFNVPDRGTVDMAQFSQDGRLLAATTDWGVMDIGSPDNVYVWNTARHRLFTTIRSPSGVMEFSLGPGDDTLTAVLGPRSAGGTLTIRRWDLNSGKSSMIFSAAELPYYLQVAQQYKFSGDEMTEAFAIGPDIDVVDVRTGAVSHFSLPGSSTVADLELDYSGARMLAVSMTGTAYAWDVPNGKMISEFQTSTDPAHVPTTYALSPDGRAFAAGNTPQLWDTDNGANMTPGKSPWPQRGGSSWEKDVFYGGDFSPDGKIYWTPGWPSGSPQVNIWDAATGFQLVTAPVPGGTGGKSLNDRGYPDLIGADGDEIEMAFLGANSGQGPTQVSLWDISRR